jgi:3-hydroxyacyl-CoA dehydrogenase
MTVSYEVRDGIAIALVDRPPVNAVNAAVRAGIIDALDKAEKDPAVKAVLVTCAGRTFLSGADITEFGVVNEPSFDKMLARLEGFPKPVAASLFGVALGGGFETAMACHYRVAVPEARVGMPEITLGVVPGAGGTQRLPRLIGARAALEMLIDGIPVGGEKAKALGLVDDVIAGDPVEAGLTFVKKLIADGAKPRPTRDMKVDTTGFDEAGIQEVLTKNARGLKGRTTQHADIVAIKAAIEKPFEEGLKIEKAVSDASLDTTESKALRHVFFAEREVAKIPGLPADVKAPPIKKAAVVGAGTMGGGIAMALADSGIPVALIEANQEALDRGLGIIRANYETSVKRGRFTQEVVDKRLALISGTLDYGKASDVDVVIEAVFENMDLKKSILKKLDDVAPAHAVLGSNTSTLSITELSEVTKRPGNVIGLHFFSPANVMKLLEIVRGKHTSPETLAAAMGVAKALRKIGVVAGDGFGFAGNRMMLDGYWREGEHLLLEGVSPAKIDAAMEDFGFAMGPNKVNDMGGIDVGTKARNELFKRAQRPQPYFAVSDAMTPLGKLGQKTGSGIYRYEKGDRTPHHDPETDKLIAEIAAKYGIQKHDASSEEIVERCVLSLVNIGARVLEEGNAYRASDLDVVWTSGYGFPRWRGGPMFYGDTLGLKHVLERVRHYHKQLNGYALWEPSKLLVKLAEEGKSFADYDAAVKS